MDYILKQFDEPLIKFSATTNTSEPEIQILWTDEESKTLFPLNMTLTPEGSGRWLWHRTIPIKKHSRYNLPPKRLRMIEKQIQKRAGILLEH